MTLPRGGLLSQLGGLSDYMTPDDAGFEISSIISDDPVLLVMLFAAIHEDVPAGAFLLLFDQATQTPATPPAQGQLAKFSLGPTSGNQGATIMLAESDVQPVQRIRDENCETGWREIRGLPFDKGCVAVLSSSIGRLTAFQNVSGMRLYARRQY